MLFSLLIFFYASTDRQPPTSSLGQSSSFAPVRTYVRLRQFFGRESFRFLNGFLPSKKCFLLVTLVGFLPAVPSLVLNTFDTYDGPTPPKEIQQGNTVFTTPVLQAMNSLNIDQRTIMYLLSLHPNQDHVTDWKIHLTLYDDPASSTRRIASLWRES